MKTVFKSFASIFLASALLAGCGSSGTSGGASPGSAPAHSLAAALVFDDVCVSTAPSFAGVPAKLADTAFRQNTQTGTYFNNVFNMSIKVLDDGDTRSCSIVFAHQENSSSVAQSFGNTLSGKFGAGAVRVNSAAGTVQADLGRGVRFQAGPAARGGSTQYYNARIIAPK